MSNTVNVSTTTNQVVITPQSTKTVSVNSGGDTSITVNQGGSNTINISNNVVNTSLTPTTVDINIPPSNGITVTDLRKTITVNQGITSTVQVATIGPQGPKGDKGDTGEQGPTGPVQNTGSLLTTASVTLNTLTFTKGDNTTFPIVVDTGSTPTLDQVLNQGSSSAVDNIILSSTTPFNLTSLGPILTDTVLTYFSGNGLVGRRDIDGRVFDDVLIDKVGGTGTGSLAVFIESQSLKSAGFVFTTGSNLVIGGRPELGQTVINNFSITSSIISASGTGSFGYMNLPNLPTSDPNEAGALFTTQSTGTGGNLEGQLVLLVSQG